MVEVAITARNANDNAVRAWGLGIDKIPTGNWLKDDSVIKSNQKSGDLWKRSLDLSDGDHTLYLIISQTPGQLGTYMGEALFDAAGYNFAGVDNDSVAAFEMKVSKGKATRKGGVPATTGPTDIPTTGTSFLQGKFGGLGRLGANIKAWNKDSWIKVGYVSGGLAVTVVLFFVGKRILKGRKRRF
jgi:hypothetical protein